jgi:RNA polymerase-binding transcription factor DksA
LLLSIRPSTRKEIRMSSSTMPAARGTSTLTDSQLDLLRELLEQQRSFRCDQLDQLHQAAVRPGRTATEQEILESLIAGGRAALREVMRALRRMDDGGYGACRHCGEQLPIERLEVLPQASQCMSCQRDAEGV